MTVRAPFAHQFSEPAPSVDAIERAVCVTAPAMEEPPTAESCGVADAFASARVRKIILLHGTFVGNDIVGLMRLLSRFSPSLTRSVRKLSKLWVDQLADENGNYTSRYAGTVARMVNPPEEAAIDVSRFEWSGENHHLGRACAAARLLRWLFEQQWDPGDRVLVLAHSHAGNVLAMLSLVLGADRVTREKFFESVRHHLDAICDLRPATGETESFLQCLSDEQRLARLPHLDVVTFGTPLRYRWNPQIVERLLHFVHHRPQVADRPYFAAFPSSIAELQQAVGGDYVQQFGIGGTDFPPPLWSWKSWRDNRGLAAMFEAGVRRRDLKSKLQRGERISRDGFTQLVDYGSPEDRWSRRLFGHGVYTCHPWLPFHLRQIAKAFYDRVEPPNQPE